MIAWLIKVNDMTNDDQTVTGMFLSIRRYPGDGTDTAIDFTTDALAALKFADKKSAELAAQFLIPETAFVIEERWMNRTDTSAWAKPPDFVKPGSMWLVVYECRYNVIQVSPQGDGFFAPGQDPLWGFSNVQRWVTEVVIPTEGEKR